MAKARMLSAKAGSDPDLNSMSIEAELIFLLTIPHLDRDGLIEGNPIPLWGKVAPCRVELMDKMARIIQEWVEHNLIVRYEWKDGAILFFKGFRKHNINMTYEREPESYLPPPPGFRRVKNIGLIPNDPELAGRLAESIGERSIYHVALVEASKGAKDVDITLHVKSMKVTRKVHAEVEEKLIEEEREEEGEVEESNSNGAEAPARPSSSKDHPLIRSFHELLHRYPNKTQMAAIIEHDPPPEDWRRAIHAWAMAGHNPTNVQGMLDWALDPARIDGNQRASVPKEQRKMGYSEYDYLLAPVPKQDAAP